MNDSIEVVPGTRRRWPFAVAFLVALAWVGLAAYHAPHQSPWQNRLDEFRDSGAEGTDEAPNRQMSDMIVLKNSLQLSIMRGRTRHLSPTQARQAIACLNGPMDELSQSEALDALALARRAGYLSPDQIQEASAACVSVLSRTPPPMVRLEGARFLSHSKDSKSIRALRLLLNDPAPNIREAAVQGLTEGH